MRYPESIISEIDQRLSIVDIVGSYVALKPKGNRYWGLCPFHNEKTASFSVTPEKNLYYCFGCHKGGSLFNFVMEMENLNYPESIKYLAEKAGVVLPDSETSPQDRRKQALWELNRRVTGSFHYLLKENRSGETARNYLKERALDESVIDSFQLGYAPEERSWLFNFLTKKGYTPDFLQDSGLFSRKYPQSAFFRHRVMFPIFTLSGEVIGFGARALREGGPKYLNTTETLAFSKRQNLYGLYQGRDAIRKEGFFLLVEGYTDVLAFHQAGILQAVAPLGTSFTEEQARKISRFASRALLVFDGDSAGRAAAAKASRICETQGIESEIIPLPEGSDPADILKKEGPERLKKLLKYSINSFEYLLDSIVKGGDPKNSRGKESIINEIFPYIKAVESEVKRQDMLQKAADRLSVDIDAVRKDYSRFENQNGKGPAGRNPEQKKALDDNAYEEVYLSDELFLILAVTVNRDFFQFLRSKLDSSDFTDENAREVFIALEDCYRADDSSEEGLFSRIDSASLKRLIAEKSSSGEFELNQERLIKDGIKRIKGQSLKRKQREVQRRLRLLDKENDAKEAVDLLSEKMFLDKELEKLRTGY